MRSLSPLVAVALVSGCALFRPQVESDGAPGPAAPKSACAAFAGQRAFTLDLHDSRERQLLGLACFDHDARPADVAARAYVQLHAGFDDRHFDPLVAAEMVVACAGDGACRAKGEPESLGEMVFYAQGIDPLALRRALQKTSLPAGVQRSFLARAQASRTRVVREAARLDPQLHALYVDVPAAIRASDQRFAETFASFYARYDRLLPALDAALAHRAPARRLTALLVRPRALRDAFLSRCAARAPRTAVTCLSGPIARPLTRRLVELAIRLHDPVLGRTEEALLHLGPDASTTARRIARALAAAIAQQQVSHQRWAEAKAMGANAAPLAAVPPVDVPDLAWRPPENLAGFRAQLRAWSAKAETVRGTVRFVRRRGDAMEIYFRDRVVGGPDCAPAPPDEHGQLPDCPADPRRVKVARILLAVADAKPLLIGNQLEAVVDPRSRRGLAVEVFQSKTEDRLIQLRSVRWRR